MAASLAMRFLKTCLLPVTLCLVMSLPVYGGSQTARQASAVEAAEQFLGQLDQGAFARSWDEASSLLAKRIPKEEWLKTFGSVRPPLGKMLTRTLKGSHHTTILPGAPEGEYVLTLFITSFEHKTSAVETVTMVLGPDDQWQAAGYFIE